MYSKTEEFLAALLWTCEFMRYPRWRMMEESFESWAYRNGFRRQLYRLEEQKWLESRVEDGRSRVYRLSEAGRIRALGGVDPMARWNRLWDGCWRLVLFDVAESERKLRNKLRLNLLDRGFGYLQHSVWITPDPLTEERALLADLPVNVGSLLLLEARPNAGETDAEIVAGAWDFAEMDRRYEAHENVLALRPRRPLDSQAAARKFQLWFREEQAAWRDAIKRDPLLPTVLLPSGYRGREAWQRRLEVMREAGEQMRGFVDHKL